MDQTVLIARMTVWLAQALQLDVLLAELATNYISMTINALLLVQQDSSLILLSTGVYLAKALAENAQHQLLLAHLVFLMATFPTCIAICVMRNVLMEFQSYKMVYVFLVIKVAKHVLGSLVDAHHASLT